MADSENQNVEARPNAQNEGSTVSVPTNHSVSKRLQHELMTLMVGKDEGISAFPEGDNLFKWIGTIEGPENTVYQDLSFKLSMEFPSTYPYTAPTVKFITGVYHPNVDLSGIICLDILKEKWSASYDVRSILLSIQSLLNEPNNKSPLNDEAARMWRTPAEFKKRVINYYNRPISSSSQDASL